MPNFFTDNPDIIFQFENLAIEDIVELTENFYEESKEYNYAPTNYADAIESYKKILEIVGDISGNFIAPRASEVDEQGNTIEDGKVVYAKGTQENLNPFSLVNTFMDPYYDLLLREENYPLISSYPPYPLFFNN